jgi:arginase
MAKRIDFLGLGQQSGQELKGAMDAPESYLSFLQTINFNKDNWSNHGIIKNRLTGVQKLNSNGEIENFDFDFYIHSFFRLLKIYERQNLVLNWGGDHSVALSTVSAYAYHYSNGYVLWIDAHADLNLPDHSLTKNLHGMPVSLLLNLQQVAARKLFWIKNYIDPRKLIYVGLRDLDPFEQKTLDQLKIKYFTCDEVRKKGMDLVTSEISSLIGDDPLHISFDIDSLDPAYAPSTGLNIDHGLSLSELTLLGSSLSRRNVKSIDVVEINPQIGSEQDVLITNLSAHLFIESIVASQKQNSQIFQGGKYDQFHRTNKKHDPTEMESRL